VLRIEEGIVAPGSPRPVPRRRTARSGGQCYDICNIRSVCEQSGRTTGRLGSMGLLAMPSKGRRSRHSEAYLPQLPQPGLDTISDDYGLATTCRRMVLAAAAGARATRMSPLWAGEAAGGRGQERHRDRATGSTITRLPGAGRRVSLEHGTRSLPQATRSGMCFGTYYSD
jgi:hypothetical protein